MRTGRLRYRTPSIDTFRRPSGSAGGRGQTGSGWERLVPGWRGIHPVLLRGTPDRILPNPRPEAFLMIRHPLSVRLDPAAPLRDQIRQAATLGAKGVVIEAVGEIHPDRLG